MHGIHPRYRPTPRVRIPFFGQHCFSPPNCLVTPSRNFGISLVVRRRGSDLFFYFDSPIKKIVGPIIISYRLRELLSEASSSVRNIFPRAIRYLRPYVYKSSSGVQDGRLVGSAAARARCYSVGQASKVCFGVGLII
jgi:hypothetical protein